MAAETPDQHFLYPMLHVSPADRARILAGEESSFGAFDVTTATVACGDGDMELVKSLFERGCEMSDTCAIYAAGSGHLDILRYLRNIVKLPFADEQIWKVAEREGRENVIAFLQLGSIVALIQKRDTDGIAFSDAEGPDWFTLLHL